MSKFGRGFIVGIIASIVIFRILVAPLLQSRDCARDFGMETHEYSDCVYQKTYGDKKP